ncbi:MAG: hypothetical protein J6A01_09690, partial [Proteobacteria bacterium]|nr:hypothetical protein [Pseudomonadota bacterium]
MKKQLYAAMLYHQQVLSEKNVQSSRVTIGKSQTCDFVVGLEDYTSPFVIYEHGTLNLKASMYATLSVGGKTWSVGEERTPKSVTDGVESYEFGDDDWVIANLSPGLDIAIFYKSAEVPPLAGMGFISLTQALESPVARMLVLSFALHSALILFASWKAEPIEKTKILGMDTRWVELISEVQEHEQEEKEEEVPVIEDVDNMIIDDSMKDMDRPKIDDTDNPIANLNKVDKPVGIQAALGGAKLHD